MKSSFFTRLVNGRIVDLESKTVEKGELIIYNGHFVSSPPEGISERSLDIGGAYIIPGLIDGHLHIESSMLTPLEFAREAVCRGTTSLFVDPHEIANVLGRNGIDLFITQSENLPLTMRVGIPSCVPATPMETAGAQIGIEDVRDYLADDRVFGLAEMMNFPGIIHGLGDAREKVAAALEAGKTVDGHCPGLRGDDLSAYISNGVNDGQVRIGSEHEASTPDEAIEKWEKGMFIMLRYGSASKDLLNILPEICRRGLPLERFGLVSDDLTAADLRRRGHMDHIVKVAAGIIAESGYCSEQNAVLHALAMASLYPARYFNTMAGAFKPGAVADLAIVDSLDELNPETVFSRGRMVKYQGELNFPETKFDYSSYYHPLRIPEDMKLKLTVRATGDKARVRVIGAQYGSLLTESMAMDLPVSQGEVRPDPERDILKLAVIERHSGTGNVGVGFVKGFGFKKGALAGTVAHDSHNLIVVASDDQLIEQAISALCRSGGGLAAVREEGREAVLPLSLGGLMSVESADQVLQEYQSIHNMLDEMDCPQEAFSLLSFLALPVIPSLKLTDLGLVDVDNFSQVDLIVDNGGG